MGEQQIQEPIPTYTPPVSTQQPAQPLKPKKKHGCLIALGIVGIIVVLIIVIIILASAGANVRKGYEDATEQAEAIESREDYMASCVTLDYEAVERDPEKYIGTRVYVSGEVVQVSESGSRVYMRIESKDGIWYAEYKLSAGESRILENDKITVYGRCTGVETYTAIFGNQVTIPSMDVFCVELSN